MLYQLMSSFRLVRQGGFYLYPIVDLLDPLNWRFHPRALAADRQTYQPQME